VAVLDIRMPGMDGFEVMRSARQLRPDLAVIFLTGHATLESAVAALRSHAADYLFKPVGMRDLATAVAGAVRQRAQGRRPPNPAPERFLQVGSVILDRKQCRVIVPPADAGEGVGIKLTASEASLLDYLMQRPGVAVSCAVLAQAALGYDVNDKEAPSIVRPHVCRLRKKIEPDPTRPRFVLTVPGRRYLFHA
jgi:DNA-binding response OmpR family regulator